MKKLSVLVALVGIISTACFGTRNHNYIVLQQGPNKQAPKTETSPKGVEVAKPLASPKPERVEAPQKVEQNNTAAHATSVSQEKSSESKQGNNAKSDPKKPHSSIKSHPVKNVDGRDKATEAPKAEKK